MATAQRVSLVGGTFHAFKELVETLRNDRVDELRGNGKGHRLCYFRDLDVRSNLFAGWKQLAAMSKKKRTVVKRGDRRLVTHLFEGWRNHARTSAQERRMLTEVLESWIGHHRIQRMQLLRIRKSKHRKTMKNVFFTWIEQTVEREVNAAHTYCTRMVHTLRDIRVGDKVLRAWRQATDEMRRVTAARNSRLLFVQKRIFFSC